MTSPTLFKHPLWHVLLPHLYIAQGEIGVNGPRHRIEVHKDAPPEVLDMVVRCAADGVDIHCVRLTKRGVWTLNVSCPLSVNVACARMKASHQTAEAVRAAMEVFGGGEDDDDT